MLLTCIEVNMMDCQTNSSKHMFYSQVNTLDCNTQYSKTFSMTM